MSTSIILQLATEACTPSSLTVIRIKIAERYLKTSLLRDSINIWRIRKFHQRLVIFHHFSDPQRMLNSETVFRRAPGERANASPLLNFCSLNPTEIDEGNIPRGEHNSETRVHSPCGRLSYN